jgi:hypothetical protein
MMRNTIQWAKNMPPPENPEDPRHLRVRTPFRLGDIGDMETCGTVRSKVELEGMKGPRVDRK